MGKLNEPQQKVTKTSVTNKYISIPAIPAWGTFVFLLLSLAYNILFVSWGISRDMEVLENRVDVHTIRIETAFEQMKEQVVSETIRGERLQRDVDEIKLNLKFLMEAQGLKYQQR